MCELHLSIINKYSSWNVRPKIFRCESKMSRSLAQCYCSQPHRTAPVPLSLYSSTHKGLAQTTECSSQTLGQHLEVTREHFNTQYIVWPLSFQLDPNLGQGKCAIRWIPCACQACTDQLDKTWIPGKNGKEHPQYADVPNCVYVGILDSFNKWNIIIFSNKETEQEN